jgi:hypothetical protein
MVKYMSTNSFNHRLSTLFAGRAEIHFEIPSSDLDRVATLISESTSIDQERAEALTWGQQVDLSPGELNQLALLFSFHTELLALVLSTNPPSREVLLHVLDNVVQNDLNDMTCQICEDLADRVDFLNDSSTDVELLEDVSFDLLEHLIARPDSLTDGPSHEGEDNPFFSDAKMEQLIDTVLSLKEDGRKRVLAYAYRELQALVESEAGAPIGNMEGYSRLREKLKPLPRSVFDLIARSPFGALSAPEVVEALSLSGMRSLGQLERSLLSTLQDLSKQGVSFTNPPLKIERKDHSKELSLSVEALSAWQAILHAEDAAATKPSKS